MNKTAFVCLWISMLFLNGVEVYGQEKINYTLQDIVARAKAQSTAALRAQTIKENRFWQYRLYQSDYNPQLRLEGTIPSYTQSVNNVTQPDGSIEFREVKQNLIDVGIGLQQAIAATGGVISVNSSTSRFDNFLAPEGLRARYSGVPVNIRLNQPIFAFNPYKWDKRIQPLVFEESKREYVEEMEQISRLAAQFFFDYLLAQVNLDIAEKNLKNTEDIYKIENGRYNIGTTSEDHLLQVELQVLQAKQDLAGAKLDMETSMLTLKSYVGLNENANVELILPDNIPSLQVDVDRAIELAFQNRSVALGFDRQLLEAEEGVARARGQRFQMNLNASYGYNNAASTFENIYVNPNQQALVNLGISMPILDWGRTKARMEQSRANQRLTEYSVEQEKINFEQEIYTMARNFQMLEDRLEITELSDKVADKRYEISRDRYLTGRVTITDLNIAQTEKDANKRAYIASLREYWSAYYQLRQLTLYDFETDSLLYIPEGE
ncbi:MAG TPA: TolC family protein [Cyclobacteriaceae bacterium]|nr:TolC family protein [Cyclobacteriaceae bacterium]